MEATISWITDVPATTEITYGEIGAKYRKTFTAENLLSNRHNVTLGGLKHKNTYSYRVISRDISGNMLQSKEYFFDTSEDVSRMNESRDGEGVSPLIRDIKVFKTGRKDDFYLQVSTNKAVEFLVWFTEIQQMEERQCYGYSPTRYSTIDVCLTCHKQDASHPVGVRSRNPKIKISEDLTTIEEGVLTCVTCHAPHGGEKVYFIRTIFPKNLCIKCHVGYIK